MRRGISKAGLRRIAQRKNAQVAEYNQVRVDVVVNRMLAAVEPVIERYLLSCGYDESVDYATPQSDPQEIISMALDELKDAYFSRSL